MAIKSTIFKANVQIADVDHGYYADHALTLARHPSENDERMMVRLVALALNAHQLNDTCNGDATLSFGAGLSDPEEPDVQLVDFTGRKRLWMEVGQPEGKPLSKACSKADSVLLYAFSSSADIWWNGIKNKLTKLGKLQVWRLPTEQSQALVSLAQRSMHLQATIQENTLTLSSDQGVVTIEPIRWK